MNEGSAVEPTGTVQLKFNRPRISRSRGTIPGIRDFRRDLAPVLKGLDSSSQRRFIDGAHTLAKRKLELERLREHYRQQRKGISASLRNHKKLTTLIGRAISTLKAAHKVAETEDDQLLKNFEVTEATRMLMAAKNDLVWVTNHMFPAMIYPSLRKDNEKPLHFEVPEHAQPTIPGFGVMKIDYWLMDELDQLLTKCRTPQGKQVVNRTRIIQAVFSSAFVDDSRQIDQIKTALRRIRKQRVSDNSPRQNNPKII